MGGAGRGVTGGWGRGHHQAQNPITGAATVARKTIQLLQLVHVRFVHGKGRRGGPPGAKGLPGSIGGGKGGCGLSGDTGFSLSAVGADPTQPGRDTVPPPVAVTTFLERPRCAKKVEVRYPRKKCWKGICARMAQFCSLCWAQGKAR